MESIVHTYTPKEKQRIRRTIQHLATCGVHLESAARMMGVSRATIRRWEIKTGIKLARYTGIWRSYYELVENMKPQEAIEFLIELHTLRDQVNDVEDRNTINELGLTFHEARIFQKLLKHKDKAVSRERLYNALYFDRIAADDHPDIKIIDVFVCKIRQKLAGSSYEIKTHWGFGYSILVSDKEETLNAVYERPDRISSYRSSSTSRSDRAIGCAATRDHLVREGVD